MVSRGVWLLPSWIPVQQRNRLLDAPKRRQRAVRFTLPASSVVREFAKSEIKRLERALGSRIELNSTALSGLREAIIRLVNRSSRLKDSQRRSVLLKIHNAGEKLCALIEGDMMSRLQLGDEALESIRSLCGYAVSEAAQLNAGVARGHPKRIKSDARKRFLMFLIAMGERIGLRPTGAINVANAENGKFSPFHMFATEAINFSKDVIMSSPSLSKQQKSDACRQLYFHSARSLGEALGEVLKEKRSFDALKARFEERVKMRAATGAKFIPPWQK